MNDFETQFTARIRISPESLEWIKKNKPKDKTAAAFLEQIIQEFIKPNLFKKKK